ncbi:putative histone lysine N-methyltransferase [Naematelia encephala]|uniref:Putative histone lysine N-methyltransferase n=1 Tax=Naematelia encephala TaxID=71784 RepID=A0A1Y2AEU8_9TREE|nr:putative histone lysine N-methyltransferase [Naematelia encephala]
MNVNQKPRGIILSEQVVNQLRPAKVFSDAIVRPKHASSSTEPCQITSVSFDDTGEKCLTCGEDENFVVWDARKGSKSMTFPSQKYGVSLARFTHRSANILHASTKMNDHAIRYHSTHDNKYLSYFKGHTARVLSLQINPTNDTFLSAGDDGTARLWDLRMPSCVGLLNDVGGATVAAFDNTGAVLAVACSDTQTIMLYSAASMDKAPFHYASLIDSVLAQTAQPPPKPIFSSLSFSNDGKYLLVGTSSDAHYILDAFTLQMTHRLVGHQGLERDRHGQKDIQPRRGASGEELSWSADSQWIASGSADSTVYLWRVEGSQTDSSTTIPQFCKPVVTLRSGDTHEATGIRTVAFNPRFAMLAAAGEKLSFWLPAKDEESKIAEGW